MAVSQSQVSDSISFIFLGSVGHWFWPQPTVGVVESILYICVPWLDFSDRNIFQRSFLQKISADQNITNSSRILPHITSPLYSRMSVHKLDILHFLHCTMSPLLTRNCFKSNKVRPISNCWFCHLIYKKICLNVLESKQRREKLVFVIL